ncbi:fibronectin type III domain-containing protein [Paenibacillus sp. GP183]|uniref:glycoside hydrolase family 78 protein n=1 Tax=Paenibacillus sp. GP183 TaxID=1882751 RepID=UPI0011151926|nr:fibronectin type III domain-containing protein [Paenibacillus sp. GP183]
MYEPSNNGGVADDHSIVPDANSFKDASGTIVPSSAISGIDLDPVATKCSDILTQPTCQVIQSGTINSKQFVAVSMVFNNQVYQTGSPFGYSIIGNVAMGTPGLVGNAEGRKYFMAVDIAWKGITYKYTGPFPTIDVYYDPVTSPTSTPTPTPPIVITGDFTVNPSAIKFRDSFTLHPLPFSIPAGCTYKYHQYRFSASGYFWDSPLVTSRTADSVFSYANYPTNLAVGSNTIYINVVADCASTNFITSHNLDVSAPINDRPPVFDIGWFHQGDAQGYVPIYQAVLNDYLNLRVIHDNTVTPKTPYDPDGDSIYYTWQFDASNSTWVKGLPSNYGLDVHNEAFQNLKATKLGSHTVKAVAADQFGASSSLTATIDVVMPNPVPIVSCPALVKEYRPLGATDINADKSYSPRGSAIDHTRDEWTNKLGSYYNGTLSNISTTVTLNRVYDNTGLVSDYTNPETGAFVSQASSCSITVTPDFPPVGKLQVPPLGIRGQNVTIKNLSYSPDNDQIVSVKWRYKYDSNNNGFSDDPWVNISAMDVKVISYDNNKLVFKGNLVGKYMFDVLVTEDYGKQAYASTTQPLTELTYDVINNAPTVSFTIEGENNQPGINPPIIMGASTILDKWNLYDVNSLQAVSKSNWSLEGNKIVAGLGKGMEQQETFSKVHWGGPGNPSQSYAFLGAIGDAGHGPDNITPYKAMASQDSTRSQPILIPVDINGNPVTNPTAAYDKLQPTQFGSMFRTNKKYLYFDSSNYLWAYNKSRVPTYAAPDKTTCSQYGYCTGIMEHKWSNGVNPYDFAIKLGDSYYNGYGYSYKMPDLPAAPDKIVPYYTNADYYAGRYYWNKRYNEASSTKAAMTTGSAAIGQEVAGDVIYVLYNYLIPDYCFTYNYTDSNDNPQTSSGCGSEKTSLGVWTYDAYTGALIGRTDMLNRTDTALTYDSYAGFKFFTQNDHLIVVQNKAPSIKYAEYDRTGTLVKTGSLDIPGQGGTYSRKWKNYYGQQMTDPAEWYNCGWSPTQNGTTKFWKDDKGNMYTYASLACTGTVNHSGSYYSLNQYDNPESPTGNYLIKINADFNGYTNLGRMAGDKISYGSLGPYNEPEENDPILVINSTAGVAYTRTFQTYYINGSYYTGLNEFYETVDLNTGAKWGGPKIQEWSKNFAYSPFHINADGSTAGGWCSVSASGTCDMFNWHSSQKVYKNFSNYNYNEQTATNINFGQYVGDGMFLSVYSGATASSGMGYSQGYPTYDKWMFLDVGTVNNTVAYKGFKLGQFVSPTDYDNTDILFKMNMRHATEDTSFAGFSFRMVDPKNRYAVETDGTTLFLSKYVGGARLVIKSITWPFYDNTEYGFKITMSGDMFNVYMDGVPIFIGVQDSTFTKGKIGPFTVKSFVSFTGMSSQINVSSNQWLTGYAILDDPAAGASVQYNGLTFTDPENDPMAGTFQWHIAHTPKFLNNGGYSIYNNTDLTTPQTKLDKVGVYNITLRAEDDPNPFYRWPSVLFDNYRKWSNPFKSTIIVHRRPIVISYSVTQNKDGTLNHNINDYDPDRYDSSNGNCSPPDTTGYNYCQNHGVISRIWGYVDPNGTNVSDKLGSPPIPGTYTFYVQSIDEYGAKSNPAYYPVTLGQGPPLQKPTSTLTFPTGTQANPTMIGTMRPTITWNQFDPNGYNLTGYEVQISDSIGNLVISSGAMSQNAAPNSSASWTVTMDLNPGTLYQVKVRVSDKTMQSNWSNIGWLITNRPPTATMTIPIGTQVAPTIFNSLRPTLQWSQTDLDAGTIFKAFHIQITNEANNLMILDSGQVAQNTSTGTGSWTVTSNLPSGQKLRVWVRVYDGYVWSSYSAQTWMYLNRAPIADFDWSPKPLYEGDTASFVNKSTDPDGDALTFSWIVHRPDQSTFGIVQSQFSQLLNMAGNYVVTLDVSDGKATASITKTVTVLPLTIQSEVAYTQQWLEHHQNKGHQTTLRPRDFYSGEIFIVETRSALAPVAEAKTWIDTTGLAGNDIFITEILQSTSDPNLFHGELFDPVLQSMTDGLPEGLQTIHFEIRYTNGTVKTENIPINIIGNVNQSFGVHRVR